jgi:hypothetical protein
VTAAIFALALLHELGVSSSRMELRGGEVQVTFTFSLEDLAGLARLDADRDGIVDPDEWKRVLPAIFTYIGDHFRIDGCRSEGDPNAVPNAVAPVKLSVRYVSAQPLDLLRIRCDLFREHGGNPRHVAELPGGDTIVFDSARPDAQRPIAPPKPPWPWFAAAGILLLGAIAGLSKKPPGS